MPGRTVGETVAAAKTMVSPYWTVTAPPACSAYFPVSSTSGFPLMVVCVLVIGMWSVTRVALAARVAPGGPSACSPASSPAQAEPAEDFLVALGALPVEVG